MIDTEAFREFRKALARMRDGDPDGAVPHMRRAVELEQKNPFYISYLGVVLARAHRKWGEGERLCQEALRMRQKEPQLYLNLAEIYLAAGRRDDATEALARGLRNARRDFRLNLALSKLIIRRRPVLPFLPRRHFLNRHLGRLRHRALQYLVGA